jgi:DNA-binding protein YbaB
MTDNDDGYLSPELRSLHAEAVRFTQQVAAPGALRAAHTGKDATGMVTATTGPDGRITDVAIRPEWSRRLDASALGAAVIEAVNDAAMRRFAAWAGSAGDGAAPSDGAVGARRPSAETTMNLAQIPPVGPPGDLASGRVQANIGELLQLVAGARAALDVAQQRLEERANTETIGRSPRGEVTVTLRGNQPIRVELQKSWLGRAGSGEIGTAVRVALTAAYQAYGRFTIDDAAAGGPLAELRSLTADPQTLLRKVGLLRDTGQ